ncbi:hypothetical protein [Brucella pituitosa]|uniref:hypothetical protein n=1 Tax=Brucella pituitosa TaxID=571256 RepID=UPI003F4A9A2E
MDQLLIQPVAEVIVDDIHTADLLQCPFRLIGESAEYTADALIISTGVTGARVKSPRTASSWPSATTRTPGCSTAS